MAPLLESVWQVNFSSFSLRSYSTLYQRRLGNPFLGWLISDDPLKKSFLALFLDLPAVAVPILTTKCDLGESEGLSCVFTLPIVSFAIRLPFNLDLLPKYRIFNKVSEELSYSFSFSFWRTELVIRARILQNDYSCFNFIIWYPVPNVAFLCFCCCICFDMYYAS